MSALKDCFAPHMSNTSPEASPRDRLVALKPYVVAEDYEIAAALPDYVLLAVFDKIDDSAAEMAMAAPVAPMGAPAPVAPAMPGVAAVGAPGLGDAGLGSDMGAPMGPDLGAGMDDFSMDAEMGDDLGAASVMEPAVDEMTDLQGMPPVFESVSDKAILTTFRRVIREGHNAGVAAQAIARKFGIDVADVVAVVKEAKSGKAAVEEGIFGDVGNAIKNKISRPVSPNDRCSVYAVSRENKRDRRHCFGPATRKECEHFRMHNPPLNTPRTHAGPQFMWQIVDEAAPGK
jgi:hypothetical protein